MVVVADGRVVADGSAAQIKTGVSARRISFTAAPDRQFDGLPAVRESSRQGGTLTLTTTDAEVTLRALLADGSPLPDLEVYGASLEDAVLALTAPAVPIGAR